MKQFTMVHLYSEHYESFYHESEEAIVVMHTDKRSGQSFGEHPLCAATHTNDNTVCMQADGVFVCRVKYTKKGVVYNAGH